VLALSARTIGAALLVAAVTISVSAAAAADEPARLFCIGRNKNANVVCYDVRLRKDRKLDRSDPIDAYWIMRAEDGRREELSWFERKFAYDFTILGGARDSGFRFRLDALPDRTIDVRRADQRFRAETTVAGRRSRLVSVFVQAKEGGVTPQVRYIDLYGMDLETGSRRVERVENR
jgi:hypothetical protein